MSTASYFSNLAVLGRGSTSLSDLGRRLTVRPEVEAYGPSGIVSSRRRGVVLDDATGDFSVTLFPSPELRGVDGRDGVNYILELALFEEALDDATWTVHDTWVFTAIVGGGDIKNMGPYPSNNLIEGPPWPEGMPPGAYFEPETGEFGFYGIGVK